jgi:hypothetical protein
MMTATRDGLGGNIPIKLRQKHFILIDVSTSPRMTESKSLDFPPIEGVEDRHH